MPLQIFSPKEVARHTDPGDAWIIINGDVWDVTGFAETHPGGEEIIEEHHGKDASESYNAVHGPKLAMSYFGMEKKMGKVNQSKPLSKQQTYSPPFGNPKLVQEPPTLDSIINLKDFEHAARSSLNERSWIYISGASNDCITTSQNSQIYQSVLFRPRVCKAVGQVDTSTTILGQRFEVPIFNAAASLAMLAHPSAEVALAKGLAANGSTIMIPTLASYSLDEVVEALPQNYPFFFQLYIPRDGAALEKILQDLRRLSPMAIMITVDLPVFSKREENERYEKRVAISKGESKIKLVKANQARSASAAISPNVTWAQIKEIKKVTGIPIFVKGIQCAEDAAAALKAGCEGIYLSNHGGRSLDTAQPPLVTLAEINIKCPQALSRMSVLIDGGILRGTDVLKAICLGAHGVCLGRPMLYSLIYGEEGVRHLMNSK
ncbi:hypothetical protein ACHAPT_008804 [Fusarium lateritium]